MAMTSDPQADDSLHEGNGMVHQPRPTLTMPQAGTSQREEFGGTEMVRSAETAGIAAAEQARALVEARYIVAMKRPRNVEQFRVELLRACKRPGFAETAMYAKPIGKAKDEATGEWVENFARGLSIRFVEEALRCYRNVDISTATIFDDANQRIIRVTVSDIESGIYYSLDVRAEKTVERSSNKGRIVISSRKNSYGKETYLLVATEDEMLVKAAALVSKAIRENGRRVLPGDILEEALQVCRKTLSTGGGAAEIEQSRMRAIDSFAAIGITPDKLAAYLGHEVGTAMPLELEELRAVLTGIKDGETTWAAVMEAKRGPKAEEGGGKVIDTLKTKLRDKVKKAAEKKAEASKPGPAPTPAHDPATGEVAREPGED